MAIQLRPISEEIGGQECSWCGATDQEERIWWGVPDQRGQTVNLCDDCYHEVECEPDETELPEAA